MRKTLNIAIALLIGLLQVQAQKTFTVVIDAGHGGKDPGTLGSISKEKAINLAVALKLGSLIEQNNKDVRVIYTRKTDVFIELDERAKIANKNKADLFISIHANSVNGRDKSASGAETYTLGLASSKENLEVAMRENSVIMIEEDYLLKYEGFDPESSESYIIFEFMQNKHMEQSVSFASEIQKAFKKAKRRNRGVKQAGFLVLRKTSMPSVLIELGFISNKKEERYLASKAGQKELAKAIYNAFDKFKKDYERKLGNAANRYITTQTSTSKPSADIYQKSGKGQGDPSSSKNSDKGIVYKIQILTSDKKLSSKNKIFKGYDNISYYKENGTYKYTYGATSDYSKIYKMYKKASKDFKGAFIIKTKNGQRIN